MRKIDCILQIHTLRIISNPSDAGGATRGRKPRRHCYKGEFHTSTELARLVALSERLAGFAPGERAEFAALLKTGVEVLDLEPSALAGRYETTASTISRWSNGRAAPAPYIQRKVIADIRDRAEERLAFLKRYADETARTAETATRLVGEVVDILEHVPGMPDPAAVARIKLIKSELERLSFS